MLTAIDLRGFPALVTSESALAALRLSLLTSSVATAVSVALGVPLALVLARTTFHGHRVVRAFVLMPLVLPPVVGGIALLSAFGRRGLLGESLEVWGLGIAFSTTAVIIAQAFVAMPFLVLSVEGALRGDDGGYEETAATLGAGPTRSWWLVTLPRIAPALIAGVVLTFARALGEFGATITFAGSLQGVTRTLPLEIYLQRETDPDAAVAVSLLLVAVAIVVMVLTYSRSPDARIDRRRRKQLPVPTSRQSSSEPVRLDLGFRAPERGVSIELSVEPGQTVAVIGPNGSGKSTTLAVIAGLIRPSDTWIRLDGIDVTRVATHRRGVGLLSQRPNLFPHLDAISNVAFGPKSRRNVRGRQAQGDALATLAEVDAELWADRYPDEVSGGQAARIALARAIAADPAVLLLDEPLAALDAKSAPQLRLLLKDILAGRTVVLVTHSLADIRALADHVVVLGDGAVIDSGSIDEILSRLPTDFIASLAEQG